MNIEENNNFIDEIVEKELKIKFIKKFAKLNLTDVCKKVGVARQSIYMGEISLEKLNRVVDEISCEIADLWEN